ncbi:hypothetical protein E1161_06795 [Saccharopolyspora aridisoli]|uniref:Uncharacterized protein n=1 Tax=Saccharopolyspora aridisoli TaxID=2530385 RepID=A0A4R4UZN6_9PSEU|nr:hypothetical protein [Saccharopolyspora aridisoli]TDC94754.1 hypothetical protein E1161_06795 [Saccharopolyspora aridisoli]
MRTGSGVHRGLGIGGARRASAGDLPEHALLVEDADALREVCDLAELEVLAVRRGRRHTPRQGRERRLVLAEAAHRGVPISDNHDGNAGAGIGLG